MDKRTTFRVSLIAAALASLGGFAAANAIVLDNRGMPVTSGAGECVGSGVAGVAPDCMAVVAAPATGVVMRTPDAAAPATDARAADGTAAQPAEMAAMSPDARAIRSPIESGFVSDGDGDVVRSGVGDCVQSGTGAAPTGLPLCGGTLAAQAIPPPIPEPQTQAAAPPPATEQPREIPLRRITLDADTTFAFDSAELTQEGREQLQSIVEAGAAEEVERLRVHVTGYADRIGSEDYNLSLSEQRAEAVRQYFVDNGMPAEVITAEGRGETNPVVQCEGMSGISLIECLRPNRRSEVEFAALERGAPEEETTGAAPPSGEPWAPATDTGTPR